MIPRVDARRDRRLPLRAVAELSFGAGRWSVIAEDFHAGGCQLLAPLPLRRGETVWLTLALPGEERLVEASATVAWARRTPPYRTGVAFTRSGAEDRARAVRALVERDPALTAPAPPLRPGTRLRLGPPPPPGAVFSRAERAVLRAVREGVAAGDLVCALAGATLPDGGATLRSLCARGLVTLGGHAVHDERWDTLLADAGPVLGAIDLVIPPDVPSPFAGARGGRRSPATEALLAAACAEGAEGRLGAAVEWLQAALAASPDDADLAAALDALTLSAGSVPPAG